MTKTKGQYTLSYKDKFGNRSEREFDLSQLEKVVDKSWDRLMKRSGICECVQCGELFLRNKQDMHTATRCDDCSLA